MNRQAIGLARLNRMNKYSGSGFHGVIGAFVSASSALAILLAFLVVIPLTLWFAWARHSTVDEPLILTLFCLSFGWLNLSSLKWYRSFRRLGESSSSRSLLGPRPEDPDELLTWQWGRQFRYSLLAVLLCMLAFGITKWLHGD